MKNSLFALLLSAFALTAGATELEMTVSSTTLDRESSSGQYTLADDVKRNAVGGSLAVVQPVNEMASAGIRAESTAVGFTHKNKSYSADAVSAFFRLQTPPTEGAFVFGEAGLKYHFCDKTCVSGAAPVYGVGVGIHQFRLSISRSAVKGANINDNFWYTSIRAGFSIPF